MRHLFQPEVALVRARTTLRILRRAETYLERGLLCEHRSAIFSEDSMSIKPCQWRDRRANRFDTPTAILRAGFHMNAEELATQVMVEIRNRNMIVSLAAWHHSPIRVQKDVLSLINAEIVHYANVEAEIQRNMILHGVRR